MIGISQTDLRMAEAILDEIGQTACRVLILMGGYEMGSRGECRAKVRTIAAKIDRSERTVRRCMATLRDAGLWERTTKRIRWSGRVLTNLGRLVAALARGERFRITPTPPKSPPMAAHMAAHKGDADQTPKNKEKSHLRIRSAAPRESIDPGAYQRPRVANRLAPATWADLADWMRTARSVSWARCKIAHRSFSGLALALGKSREWVRYERRVRARVGGGVQIHPEQIVRAAIRDAVKSGASFGTVESAVAYISAIITACVSEDRLPGGGGAACLF